MKVLVTGSDGHLGEALVRTLRDGPHEVVGLDLLDSPSTTYVGSITDRAWVRRCMSGVHLRCGVQRTHGFGVRPARYSATKSSSTAA